MKNNCILFSILLSSFLGLSQDKNLVLHYSFNNNSDDTSPYGNDFINHGAILTEDRFGNPDAALYFDGTSSYLEIPTDESYQLAEFPFSVSLWYKMPNSSLSNNALFYNGVTSSGYGGFLMSHGDGRITANYGDGVGRGLSNRKTETATGIKIDEWQQITVVCHSFDSTQIFLDGVLQETTTTGGATRIAYGSNPIGYIGRNTTQATDTYMRGSIDELKMWDIALTPQEVEDNYITNSLNELVVLDYSFDDNNDASPYENDFINHGAFLVEDRFSNQDAALYFDGTSSYLEIPTDESYQLAEFPFSVSLWYKMPNSSLSNNALFYNGVTSSGYGGFLMSHGDGRITANYGDGEGRGLSNRKTETATGIKIDEWQQITVVCHSFDSTQIFLDGVLQETTTTGGATKIAYGLNPIGYIGLNATQAIDTYMKGSLDELKMWRKALTIQEVKDNYVASEIVGLNNFFNRKTEQIINIFPNPSSDKIFLDRTVQSIDLLSNTGKVLVSNQNSNEVSVNGLLPGLYFIRVSVDGVSHQTVKVTVE